MGATEGIGHLTTDELFRRHAGFVARFLSRLGVPKEQLDDALQEVFLVAHRNGGYRPGVAKPTSYLANIAIRAAAQHRRRQSVASQRHADVAIEHMPSALEDPASALQVRQDLQRLQRALARLPEDLCTALVLVELEGESCVSVAAGLGCPVGTIYWRLHQARKELQSALRVLDGPRRSTRPAVELDESAQPVRSAMMLCSLARFGRSEASRLLQLAREQPSPSMALDQLLARHQQLVEAGGALPAWSSGFAPHTMSWTALIGAGPIAVGLAASAAIVATTLLIPSVEPPSQSSVAQRVEQRAVPLRVNPAPASIATATKTVQQDGADEKPRTVAAERASAATSAKRGAMKDSAPRSPDSRGDKDSAPTPQPLPAAEPLPAPEPPPTTQPQRAVPQAVPEKNHASSDAELEEMRDVARAERLLTDDPAAALALTRTMQAGFPSGYFHEERAYLEVMALRELGRTREMREKAAAFLGKYPAGLYSGRVRKAIAGEAE